MFSLTYHPEADLPWQICWSYITVMRLEDARDAAAMIANLAMGAQINNTQTVLEAWDLVEDLGPTFLELCTGNIHVSA